MSKIIPVSIKLIIVGGLMGLLSACAVTTRSTEGTSETLENTTDASSDFTSSTSPRDEVKHSDAQKVTQFASANLDRLKEDMARGGGEHLTAFAHLLGIKEMHQTEFFTVTRQNYPFLFSSEPTTSNDMLARLSTELDAYPTWRQ
jgi:hypothetical protein